MYVESFCAIMLLNEAGDNSMEKSQINKKRFWLCYLYPMRLITLEGESITFTLDEINDCTYDQAILCRIVGHLSNTFNGIEIEYTICGDGALLISINEKSFSTNDLILHFNDFLCKLLLGGIYVEAINNKDITTGFLHGKNMIWPVNFGESLSSNMHARIRMRLASNTEAIVLYVACESAKSISEINTALSRGNAIIGDIDNISTFYLLTGISELRYGNWSASLSNLWIITEQITDFLWENRFLADETRNPNIPSRIQSLRQDNRTYSASVKQEILFQLGIIPADIYSELYSIRKARNRLVHEGKMVNKEVAMGLYKTIKTLLPIASKQESIAPLLDNEIFDFSHSME